MSSSQKLFARLLAVAAMCTAMFVVSTPAVAQRLLGLDVSAHQGDISTAEWATLKRPTNQQVGGVFGDGRDFVIIRPGFVKSCSEMILPCRCAHAAQVSSMLWPLHVFSARPL